MRCPRCHREIGERNAFCPACGVPVALGEEPAPRKLDQQIDIDRRGPQPPQEEPAGPVSPITGRTEPAPAPRAGAAPLPAIATRDEPGRATRDVAAPLPPRAPVAAAAGARAPAHRREPAPPSSLERSRWDLGAAAEAAVADAGPVELGARAREAAEDATPAGPGVEPRAAGAHEIHLRRPEGWRRASAWAIDAGPFVAGAIALARSFVREASAAGSAPGAGLLGLLDLLARERVIVLSVVGAAVLAFLVYTTLAHALAGATLGKRLLRLRVVAGDGARPSLGRSAGRSALALLSGALLGLGVVLALFTRSGRALHDLLARTWVVEAP